MKYPPLRRGVPYYKLGIRKVNTPVVHATTAMTPSMTLEEIVLNLYDVQGIKFGDFVVRTGEHSPVYIDMRVIWSYPKLVKAVSEHLWEMLQEKKPDFNTICGIPYQGIPLATALSIKHEIPMLLKRKTPKTYGTCQAMEGHYKAGDQVILIDDVLMTGGTFLEDIPFFHEEKLEVPCGVAFFNREQGGANRIKQLFGIDIHCVLNLTKAFEVLLAHGKVTQELVDKTVAYIKTNRFDTPQYLVLPERIKKDDVSNGAD